MLAAASTGISAGAIALFVVFFVIPAFFTRRIANRKGLPWFRYALRGWIGLIRLSLRKPNPQATNRAGSYGSGSGYHVPPAAGARGIRSEGTELLYGKRRR